MSEIISRPIKDGCNFNAVGLPIVYTLQRQDYEFDQINDNGGFAQLQFNGEDLTTYLEVDDEIYVEGIGLATITASSFSTNTLVTIDVAYSSTATGFVNNLSKRTDYKVEIEVFDALTDESLGPRLVLIPYYDGTIKVNIAGIVKAFLYAEWNFPSGENEAEEFTTKQVYIEIQDFYDDTYFTSTVDDSNPIIAVFAVMHLLMNNPPNYKRYAHGGNLLSYFPEDEERLFLTRFNPSYWRGYPFTLSFIWPSDLPEINRRVIQYDSEGNELSDDVTALTPDVGNVHRMVLETINDMASRVIVRLEEANSGSGLLPITEDLTVNIKNPCNNPVLLFWKNSVGGDAFWLFEESQDYQWTYPSGRIVKRLTLFADNLSISEWEGINQLNSNSEVIALNTVDYTMDDSVDKTHFRNDNQVYIINDDESKTGVIVIPTPNNTKTYQKKHEIEITIELPEFFTV